MSSATMQALQLQAPGQLALAHLTRPNPGPHDVLIRTVAATVCTSDLHDIAHNPFGIALPRVLGHEATGIVIGCGAKAAQFAPGDAVAVHPVVPCGVCVECRRGFGHHCRDFGHLGFDRDGCFAEYIVQRADRVRRVPEQVPFPVGALLEPLCVCLQAIARAGDLAGKVVLVAGDGPFGILIARRALRTARRVILAGRQPFRLKQVEGAVPVFVSDEQSALAEILGHCAGGGVDVAILAVSSDDALQLCLSSLRPRGRMVLFSALGRATRLDLTMVHLRELEIVGACNDEERLDEAIALLADPALALDRLITHEIPFANWPDAFRLARDHHHEALKVALTFPTP